MRRGFEGVLEHRESIDLGLFHRVRSKRRERETRRGGVRLLLVTVWAGETGEDFAAGSHYVYHASRQKGVRFGEKFSAGCKIRRVGVET